MNRNEDKDDPRRLRKKIQALEQKLHAHRMSLEKGRKESTQCLRRINALEQEVRSEREKRLQAERRAAGLKRDSLTGLLGRTVFLEDVECLIAIARRHKWSVGVMFADLDGMKAMNDTLGHGVGDWGIKISASVITGSLREEDLVCRWGGDEFVAAYILDSEGHIPIDALRCVEGKIRSDFSVYPFAEKLGASLGISIGSVVMQKGEPFMSALKRADEALYQEKEKKKEAGYTR